MEVRFVVVSPASQQRSISVRLPIVVGRSDEAKFRIPKDSVSRRHCECFIEDGEVFIRDLGSTNGTLLDDELLPANVATRVPSGAKVRVGSVVFRVEYGPLPEPAPAQAPAGDDTVPLAEKPDAGEQAVPVEEEATAFAWPVVTEQPAVTEAPVFTDAPAGAAVVAETPAGEEPPAPAEAPVCTEAPADAAAVAEAPVVAETPAVAEAPAGGEPSNLIPEPPPAEPQAEGFDWLNAAAAEPAPAADDDKLEDFFKSLS